MSLAQQATDAAIMKLVSQRLRKYIGELILGCHLAQEDLPRLTALTRIADEMLGQVNVLGTFTTADDEVVPFNTLLLYYTQCCLL